MWRPGKIHLLKHSEIPQQLLNFADSVIILSGSPNHLYILWSNWLQSFSGSLFLFGSATMALNDPLFKKKSIYLTVGLDTTLPLSQLSSGWMLFINKMIWKAGEWDLCAQGKCSEQKLRSILEKEISPFKKNSAQFLIW